jgi:hypothetical protein
MAALIFSMLKGATCPSRLRIHSSERLFPG